MNIEEFLRRGGAELPAVVHEANAKVGLASGDVLLAVGSLAEDMGTSRSDLDLLLITARSEDKFPAVDHVPLLVERCFVDVQLWRLAEFEKLIARFNAWSQTPWDVMHAVNFTTEERTLLHRLLHGQLLKGDRRRLMKRLPPRRDLARLRLQVARQAARTIQVDMSGYREIRDYQTLVFAAQELLGHAVDALLASYEITNPLVKWRSRLLSLLPSDWDRSLGIPPTRVTAQQYVWDLHRAPERPEKKLALEHAFRITTFARAAFLSSELRLVQNSLAAEPIAWRSTRMKPQDETLPYLDFDVDFLVGDDRVFLARLNEFEQPIELSASEFRLTLLFDGTTTVSQAKRISAGSRRASGHSTTVEDLIARIGHAGLTVSSNGAQK
jgi:hypothetical protein